MTQAEKYHNEAMEWASKAHIEKLIGNAANAIEFTEKALHLEAKAAMLLAQRYELEPTRSILFRSAATLAMNANKYTTALEFIGKAFEGTPDATTELQLIDVFKTVSQKHYQSIAAGLSGYAHESVHYVKVATAAMAKQPLLAHDDITISYTAKKNKTTPPAK